MLDETFILETPPLRAGWTKIGVQAEVPITGNHARRVIHGARNVMSGHVEFLITEDWTAATHQACLHQVRQAWRGWHIVLVVDRGSPHTAKASRALAAALDMEVRWPNRATTLFTSMGNEADRVRSLYPRDVYRMTLAH